MFSLKCGAVVFSVASEERKVPIDTRHQTANLPSSTILPELKILAVTYHNNCQ